MWWIPPHGAQWARLTETCCDRVLPPVCKSGVWRRHSEEDSLLLQRCSVSYRSGPTHMDGAACFFLHHRYSVDPHTTSKTCDKRPHAHRHTHTGDLTCVRVSVCAWSLRGPSYLSSPPSSCFILYASFSAHIKHKQRKQLGRLICPSHRDQNHILLLPSPTTGHRGDRDVTQSKPEIRPIDKNRWQKEQTSLINHSPPEKCFKQQPEQSATATKKLQSLRADESSPVTGGHSLIVRTFSSDFHSGLFLSPSRFIFFFVSFSCESFSFFSSIFP